jgi:glutamine phosphoribosylpyrophosphate amidotransferase
MCSLFGFVARKGHPPVIKYLENIVEANYHRGPHAMGFAWIDENGRLRMWKSPGNPLQMLPMLRKMEKAAMLVGHIRYTTHGHPENNINNHPHPCDGGWIVHNGVVRNHAALISKFRLVPTSDCDSELIGMMAEQSTEPTAMGRLLSAVEQVQADAPLAVLGLWTRRRQLVAIRRNQDLHISRMDHGFYFGTLADGLPGKQVYAMKNYEALRMTQKGAVVLMDRDVLRGPRVAATPYRREQSRPMMPHRPNVGEITRRLVNQNPAPAARTAGPDVERIVESAELFDNDDWWKRKPGSTGPAAPRVTPADELDDVPIEGDDEYQGG